MERKYSLLYYNDEKVDYNHDVDLNKKSVLEDLKKEKNVVIIKNKEMDIIDGKIDYDVIKVGRKYTMIKRR
jgi:hypothetical protein